MADEKLSDAVRYLVEKSLVDAYIEVVEKHPDEGDGDEYSSNNEFIVGDSDESLDGEKSDEHRSNIKEVAKVTSKVDDIQGIKFISLNELPSGKEDTDTEDNNDDRQDKHLVKQTTNSDYEASVESEVNDEVSLGMQDVVAESSFEKVAKNDAFGKCNFVTNMFGLMFIL